MTAEYLKKAGIKIKYGSTHAKGFCVDGRFVLFGSTNLTHQSIMKNNETNLFFDNPKIADGFLKYFDHLWGGGKHGGIKLPPPLIADGGFIHDHASFALSYVRRTHGTADRLRAGGIKNLTYGPKHLFTHSKYLIRDRKELALGTGNWLHEDIKVHPQLYVRLEDPAIAKELALHLASQMKEQLSI